MNLHSMHLERVLQNNWNKCSLLPQITTLFEFLQKFIIKTNWKLSNCSELETTKIENNLNNLLCLLQAQKVYGRQYWLQNERRVQASVVHHFFYLKLLILAIIPQNCKSISQAVASKRLCIQITKIEDLINNYLQSLKQLYLFLHKDKFNEQRALTKELFQSINKFWQRLPQLTKSQLSEIPKIMRYICLNNTLDSTLDNVESNDVIELRKKSETIENNGRIAKPDKRTDSCFDRKSDRYINRQSPEKQIRYDSTVKTESKEMNSDKRNKKMLFFKFKKQSVYKSPTRKIEKSYTIISQQTIKNKLKLPHNDRFRSTTFIPEQYSPALKNKTSTKDSRLTVQKSRGIGQARDRLRKKSINSDLSVDNLKIMLERCDEQQLQRRVKKKGTKWLKQKVKLNTISNFMQLQTGKVKGWAVVRQKMNQKIVKNKLRKLLLT